MAVKIPISQYDNFIKILLPIKVDNITESLQGATVELKLKNIQEGIEIIKQAEITDATMGECQVILTTQDTSVVGAYISEVETRFANGTILSKMNPIVINIIPEQIACDVHQKPTGAKKFWE